VEDGRYHKSRDGPRPTTWSLNTFLDFLNFRRKREGKIFCFQRLARAFIGADSKKLKMRRLPNQRENRKRSCFTANDFSASPQILNPEMAFAALFAN
jgi:hypothetical protein